MNIYHSANWRRESKSTLNLESLTYLSFYCRINPQLFNFNSDYEYFEYILTNILNPEIKQSSNHLTIK
jgi:hypothetical protein